MIRPSRLPTAQRWHAAELVASCPPMTALATRVHEFAQLPTRRRGTDLRAWIDDGPRQERRPVGRWRLGDYRSPRWSPCAVAYTRLLALGSESEIVAPS
jgi:hypothetical protein